ncbi:MAG TPA: hypothetical protein ENJ09_06450 [Planctomycetes bacterium]|nr:hypothetical protein [Planctomycetota bacterium]
MRGAFRRRLLRASLLLLLPSIPVACGWHAGLAGPDPGSSVGVEVFHLRRDILERGLEPKLQAEVARALVDLVRAPIDSPRRADLIVRGEIVDVRRRQGIRSQENQLAETGLLISARASLVDRRSGEVLATSPLRHIWSGYATGEEAPENEAGARERALRHLAETLVLDLFRTGESRTSEGE